MKNLSLYLNIILLLAVGFLYYKVYSNQGSTPLPSKGTAMRGDAIVFVNSDSLLKNFDYYNELLEDLQAQEDSVDMLLKSRSKSLEVEFEAYQSKAASMSPEQRAAIEEGMMGKQQELMRLKDVMVDKLQSQESAMGDSVHARLVGVLKELNKSNNFFYVLGYQRNNGILFANDSLDITKQVLEVLNGK
ncbi:MAG: OmpH family outer membrane protein [Bacteroidota bacterium]